MAELFPLWMLKYLPNMPACHSASAKTPAARTTRITMGDVSSLSALAEAVRVLERGQADALIVGGVGARLHPAMGRKPDHGPVAAGRRPRRRRRGPSTPGATAWSTAKGPRR